MKTILLMITLALLIPFAGNVSAQAPQPGSTGSGDALAKVGDQEITRAMLDDIIKTIPEEHRVPFLTPDGRKKILDEVVNFTLFAQQAKAQGMDKEPEIKVRIDYEATQYLGREFFRRRLAELPDISQEEVAAYYKSHISEFKPPDEIQARHILVTTEADANKIMEQLKGGADFAELAKQRSIDPAGQKGGKLESMEGGDWLPRGAFEKSFEQALFKLGKGELGGPLKTQFGWHVLKVEDKRQPETPALVQVQGMIRNRLMEERAAELRTRLAEQIKKTIPVAYK
jgi:peptidyl-prolyl cis-trans isomerase C